MSINTSSTPPKGELSVLIPTYNCICLPLVEQLHVLLLKTGIPFEIIVADDGSDDPATISANEAISAIPSCQYIIRSQNIGRAAIRNFLAQTARYAYLLFIDSDMTVVRTDYIDKYLSMENADVIDGGVVIGGDAETLKGNLRYLYEKASENEHTAEKRQQNPYCDFHTANFLIRREIMLSHPFDERFRYYGYEDVLFGKQLRADHIAITHIDNPMGFCTFESNSDFMSKTEEGLRTLHQFRNDLRGYSRLLTIVDGIHISAVRVLIRLVFQLLAPLARRNLCSRHPSLRLFSLYKLGYFLSLR